MDYAKGGLLILALLLAFDTATEIMHGNIEQGLTPGWTNFAIAHPTLFAFILVGGAATFGQAFIAVVDNA